MKATCQDMEGLEGHAQKSGELIKIRPMFPEFGFLLYSKRSQWRLLRQKLVCLELGFKQIILSGEC